MENKKYDIESLKRTNIHKVPDGYFDELPLKIQTRINRESESTAPVFITKMRLAWSLTAAVVIFILGWVLYPTSSELLSPEQILASIESEDLIAYLHDEEISTEDILASVDENFLLDEMSIIESESLDLDLSEDDLESIYSELDYSTEIM